MRNNFDGDNYAMGKQRDEIIFGSYRHIQCHFIKNNWNNLVSFPWIYLT